MGAVATGTPKCQSLNGVLQEEGRRGGVSVRAGSCIGVLGWACNEDAASFGCLSLYFDRVHCIPSSDFVC